MARVNPEDPRVVAERQARFRARRAEREASLRTTQEKTREAFMDVLAALMAATSAYEALAGTNKRDVARVKECQKAIARAQKAYQEIFGK